MPKGIYIRTKPVWNKSKKGCQVSWSKGLTKETHSGLARISKFRSGKRIGGKSIQLSNEEKLQILEFYCNQGKTIPELSSILGYTPDQLYLKMNRYGIDRRHNYEGLEIGRHKVGFHHSEKTKQILASYREEKHWNWQNGKSFEPYSKEFNRQFKELIRQRDNYTCQLCDIPERECLQPLCCHHIDYNKKNCLPTNIISLCHICNMKVNYNREYWRQYFIEKMKTIQEGFQLKLAEKLGGGNEYRPIVHNTW